MRACLGFLPSLNRLLLLWGLWVSVLPSSNLWCIRWDTIFWPGIGGNFSHHCYLCWLLMKWYVASQASVSMNYLQKKVYFSQEGTKQHNVLKGEFFLAETEMEIQKSQYRNSEVLGKKKAIYWHSIKHGRRVVSMSVGLRHASMAWHYKPTKSNHWLWLEACAFWGNPVSYFGELLLRLSSMTA